jgi:hypothetical protein
MATEETRDRVYGGWQPEKVAFMFGLTARRSALLGTAVLAVLLPVADARIKEAVIFWPTAAVLGFAAMVRVQGRTGDEWAASAISWAAIRMQGQHRFAGGPYVPRSSEQADDADGQLMELPGILAPLRILTVPAGGGRDLAVVHHPLDQTYTAVARVRAPGIALADSARREQRVAGWGVLLAGLCAEGSPLTRVQALQRVVPESGVALRAWHQAHLAPAVPELAQQVATELLAQAPNAAARREAFLSITMDARRVRGPIRAAGGGDAGAVAVLVRHLRALHQGLGAAELEVEGWLGARDLAEVIRVAYDPDSEKVLDARRAVAVKTAGTSPRHAGPVHAESLPGRYVHDGGVSVSYWVQQWPRSGAWCTSLAPLLADGGGRRSFGMVMEPLPPRVAERAVLRERTERDVAVRMRQRTGQIVPEHERAAMEQAAGQDAERAAGHGLVRFTGFATVTVTDPGALEDACAALEADAAAAGIELRRMWFSQDAGFALGALPLGLGLPRRRW